MIKCVPRVCKCIAFTYVYSYIWHICNCTKQDIYTCWWFHGQVLTYLFVGMCLDMYACVTVSVKMYLQSCLTPEWQPHKSLSTIRNEKAQEALTFGFSHSADRREGCNRAWQLCSWAGASPWPLPHVCVLGCFSHVWLFATLWTVARQAPLSMGFSSQE